jgi:hypothetical protein
MMNGTNSAEALNQARRHITAAEAHERKVAQHEQWAAFHESKGEIEHADAERRNADLERDLARDEWDRAHAIQGPTQLTQPKVGEPVEIPIPTREAFLRDLEKVAPPDSPDRD